MAQVQRIVGFGASSVAGCYDPTGGGFMGRLTAWLAVRAPGVAVVNRGVGGNKVADMLHRLERDVAAAHPDLIIFSPGINDVPRGDGQARTAPGPYAAAMREVLARCAACAPTLYLGPFRPDCAKLGMEPSLLRSYVAAAGAAAADLGLATIDLFEWVGADQLAGFWHSDGLHFNEAGHAFICGLLRDFLEQRCQLYSGPA